MRGEGGEQREKRPLWGQTQRTQQFQFRTLNKRQIILRAHFVGKQRGREMDKEGKSEREQRKGGRSASVWHLVGHFAIVVLTVLQAVANTCLESRHSTEEVGVARPTACAMCGM